jgi:hypothetical protein
LKDQRHLVDRTMARCTTNAFVDMNAVIEIDEVRQAVDFHPLDRLVCTITFTDGLEVRSVGVQYGMAVHAGFRRWDARNGRSLYGGVTVAAIESVIAYVVLVAELHRLRARNVLIRGVRRTRQPQNAHEPQTESRNKICAAMKNLGHVSVAL